MTMPAIPPEGNEVVDNALLSSGMVSFPFETLDGVDEGGMTDGNRVYELDADVWVKYTICERVGCKGAEVGEEVATPSELEELVGVVDTSTGSVVLIVIVTGPVSVKPPP